MALRMLGDSTRLALTQHPLGGLVTVNGTVDSKKHTFLLDTTLPGIVYRCDCNQVNDYCDSYKDLGSDSDESCPRYCKSSFNVDLIDTGSVYAGAVTSKVSIAGFSASNFVTGRVCDYYSDSLFSYGISDVVDGVLGLGPDKPSSTKNMDSLPWSKYSIYLTESPADAGSFVLAGDADADLIKQKQLTEVKLPATFTKGWTLGLTQFLAENTPVDKAYCSEKYPCDVTVSASSSVIQLDDSVWDEITSVIEWKKYSCSTDRFGTDYVYICDDDVVLPRLGFTFGKDTLFVGKEHYTLPVPGKAGRVAVLLQTREKSKAASWYLGAPFLRAFYASFDKDAKTVSFFCKKGDCGQNVKTSPSKWVENVDTTKDSTKNLRWVGYICMIFAAALMTVLVAAFLIRRKMRANANKPVQEKPEPIQEYAEAATPSKAEGAERPRDSVFV